MRPYDFYFWEGGIRTHVPAVTRCRKLFFHRLARSLDKLAALAGVEDIWHTVFAKASSNAETQKIRFQRDSTMLPVEKHSIGYDSPKRGPTTKPPTFDNDKKCCHLTLCRWNAIGKLSCRNITAKTRRIFMLKILPILCLCCAFCFLPGCKATRHGTASLAKHGENVADSTESTLAGASQSLPPGMRLGAPYTSALGESCYEVIAGAPHAAPPGRTLCLRQQGWELLPPIYMDIPTAGVRGA